MSQQPQLVVILVACALQSAMGQDSTSTSVGDFEDVPLWEHNADIYAAYVVMGPTTSHGWTALARVIQKPGVDCPSIALQCAHGQVRSEKMTPRGVVVGTNPHAKLYRKNFPITVCEFLVMETMKVTSIKVSGNDLPVPKPNATHVAWLGDSGCAPQFGQQCSINGKATTGSNSEIDQCKKAAKGNDASNLKKDKGAFEWPLSTIAATAAERKPGLVVHVGDYVYRACDTTLETCKACSPGTPWGNNWATWASEFFLPARPLLASSAWAMNRGNHEICDRAGWGYFLLIDPRPYASGHELPYCPAFTDPYHVPGGPGLAVWVYDNSNVADSIELVDVGCEVVCMDQDLTVEWGHTGACQAAHWCSGLLEAKDKHPNASVVTARVKGFSQQLGVFKQNMAKVQIVAKNLFAHGIQSIFTAHRPLTALLSVDTTVKWPSGTKEPRGFKGKNRFYVGIDYENRLACPAALNETARCFADEAGFVLYVTGHIHTSQMLTFEPESPNIVAMKGARVPPQVVVGNGGVQLQGQWDDDDKDFVGASLGGIKVKTAHCATEYGFAASETFAVDGNGMKRGGWELTGYTPTGKKAGWSVDTIDPVKKTSSKIWQTSLSLPRMATHVGDAGIWIPAAAVAAVVGAGVALLRMARAGHVDHSALVTEDADEALVELVEQ